MLSPGWVWCDGVVWRSRRVRSEAIFVVGLIEDIHLRVILAKGKGYRSRFSRSTSEDEGQYTHILHREILLESKRVPDDSITTFAQMSAYPRYWEIIISNFVVYFSKMTSGEFLYFIVSAQSTKGREFHSCCAIPRAKKYTSCFVA